MTNMMSDNYFDVGLLGEFEEALRRKGFIALPNGELSSWQGPIHPSFKALTPAETMKIRMARVGLMFRLRSLSTVFAPAT